MRGLARVGIIALVDEATQYQADRPNDELRRILEAYIVEELRPWVKTFPDGYFEQVYRLHGWSREPRDSKRPRQVGKWINRTIYEQLPPGVLDELRRLNPVAAHGYRRHKHHQFLTENMGNAHLTDQIKVVTMLMRVSKNRAQFETLFARAFDKPQQLSLPGYDDEDRPQQ
jgi:hypothetical protein